MRHSSTHQPSKSHWRLVLKLAALSAAVIAGMATNASAILVYDRAAAVAYGDKYANIVVSDGYFWVDGGTCLYKGAGTPVPTGAGVAGGVGDDCAHFVSSSIGSEQHEKGGGLTIPSISGYSQYGNPAAQGIVDYLSGSSGYGTKVSSVSLLTPGDVIGYDWGGDGHIDHVGLYTGNGKVDTHATSHKEVGWNLAGSSYPNAKFTFVHITAPGYAPGTPTNTSPAGGSSVASITPTLSGSAFVNTNLGGSQVAAEWLINFGRGVVYDSGADTTHLTSLTVPAGKLNVGNAYTWQVRYKDNYGDWSSYSSPTSLSIVAPPVPGDYNNNGLVDMADYAMWREYQGTSNVLHNDSIGGRIGLAQYDQWRSHYGQTGSISSGAALLAGAAVPEPATWTLMFLAATATSTRKRRDPGRCQNS